MKKPIVRKLNEIIQQTKNDSRGGFGNGQVNYTERNPVQNNEFNRNPKIMKLSESQSEFQHVLKYRPMSQAENVNQLRFRNNQVLAPGLAMSQSDVKFMQSSEINRLDSEHTLSASNLESE